MAAACRRKRMSNIMESNLSHGTVVKGLLQTGLAMSVQPAIAPNYQHNALETGARRAAQHRGKGEGSAVPEVVRSDRKVNKCFAASIVSFAMRCSPCWQCQGF